MTVFLKTSCDRACPGPVLNREAVRLAVLAAVALTLLSGCSATGDFGRLGAWHFVTGGWFSEVNLVRSLLEDDAG